MSSRIDGLLVVGSAFTLEKLRDERAALEAVFAERDIDACDIDEMIRQGVLACSDETVQDWVSMTALMPDVDVDGWEQFVTVWRYVGQAAHRYLSDPGPPEDVLAAAIDSAMRTPGRVLTRDEIGPWLMSIASEVHDEP